MPDTPRRRTANCAELGLGGPQTLREIGNLCLGADGAIGCAEQILPQPSHLGDGFRIRHLRRPHLMATALRNAGVVVEQIHARPFAFAWSILLVELSLRPRADGPDVGLRGLRQRSDLAPPSGRWQG